MTKNREIEAYPLSWPEGWQRTPKHLRKDGHHFKSGDVYEGFGNSRRYVGRRMISPDRARRLLIDELDRLKAKAVILSTNVPLRNDGEMRAGAADRRFDDPGIAVYFQFKGKPMVMATDAYDSIAANLRSLGLAIEALRQLERHGGGIRIAAEAGMVRRPKLWRADLSIEEIEARFRTLAKRRHPDVDGGSDELMAELNEARDDAVRALS